MKKLLTLCLLCVLLWKCQNNDRSQQIVGKWQVSYDIEKHLKQMSPEEQKIYEQLPQSLKEQKLRETQTLANQNTLEFRADKTFEFNLRSQEFRQKGTWTLINDGRTIQLKHLKPGGQYSEEVQDLSIKELNEDRMVLYYKDAKQQNQEALLIPVP